MTSSAQAADLAACRGKGSNTTPSQHALGLQLRSLLPAQFALGSKLVSSLVLGRRFLPWQA